MIVGIQGKKKMSNWFVLTSSLFVYFVCRYVGVLSCVYVIRSFPYVLRVVI